MRMFAVYGFVPTLLCLGFVLAISFLQAPLKSRAPGIFRLQALSVGRVVFRALSLIESVFLLILLGELPSDSSRVRMTVLLLAGLFAFQQIFLRWPLDRCISKSIAGGTWLVRMWHIYIVLMYSWRSQRLSAWSS